MIARRMQLARARCASNVTVDPCGRLVGEFAQDRDDALRAREPQLAAERDAPRPVSPSTPRSPGRRGSRAARADACRTAPTSSSTTATRPHAVAVRVQPRAERGDAELRRARPPASPPLTPLLAGRPTRSSHSPEKSYMPQLAMIDRTSRATRLARRRARPWSGLKPPNASVAAITARSRTVTSSEHWRKYDSTARSTGPSMIAVASAADARARGCGRRWRTPRRTPTRRPERAPGEAREQLDDATGARCRRRRRAIERRRGDRAGVDHRVRRATGARLQADRVERLAARLGADLRQHRIAAALDEREREDERLRHRLDRELGVVVARRTHTRPRGPTTARASRSGSASASSGM